MSDHRAISPIPFTNSPSGNYHIAVVGTRALPARYSGLETACEELYTRLVKKGHRVTLFTGREKGANWPSQYKGIEIVSSPVLPGKSLYTLSHVLCNMLRIASQNCFDLIHFHALAPGLLAHWRPFLKTPIISTVQGLDWNRAKWQGLGNRVLKLAEKQTVRHADEIIVVSKELQTYFKEQYGRSTYYLPNGAAPKAPPLDDRGRFLASLGLKAGEYILSLGRAVPEKRLEDLICAFRKFPANKKLAIVGITNWRDPYVRKLKTLAGADERIVFVEFQTGIAVDRLLNGALCFVSTSELEGLPLAMLEALEAGIPILASNIKPHLELLENFPGSGVLCQTNSVEDIANKLTQLLTAVTTYCANAQANSSKVVDYFNWDRIADETEGVYRRVLTRTQPTHRELAESAPAS